MNGATACLWFDGVAEEAANFYAATVPGSSVGKVVRAPADFPSGKKGDVLTVEFPYPRSRSALARLSGFAPVLLRARRVTHWLA
ncbi:MAG: VOC family protein [Burkholderiales bacterium]